jgi:hypothetical protein
MTWYAFQGLNGGKAIDLAGSQEIQATAEGFHGYATEAQAEAHPNAINVITRVFADLFISDYKAAVKEGAQPGGPNATILNPSDAAKGATSFVANSVPGLPQLGDFLGALGSKNLWIRVAKVVIGGGLVLIGLAHMTGSDHVIMQAARRVPIPV